MGKITARSEVRTRWWRQCEIPCDLHTDTSDKPMFCVISSTHSEHSNESLTPLDLNSKHGYSKVRTDEIPSQHPESRQSRISSMPYEFNHCRVPFEQAEHVMPKSDQLDAPSCYSKYPRMPD